MKEEYLQILAEKFDRPIDEIRKVVKSQFGKVKECVETRSSIRMPYFGIFMFNEKKYQSKVINDSKKDLNQHLL